VLVLTVVFAIVNICLGFALAVYLGSGLVGFQEFRGAIKGSRMRVASESTTPSVDLQSGAAAGSAAKISPHSQPVQTAPVAVKLKDGDVAELPESDSPADWDLDEKYVETSILRLNVAMLKSDSRANRIDEKLRACHGRSDPKLIEACVQLLREDCMAYLSEQKEAAEKFHNRIDEFGALNKLAEEIEMANLEQSAQMETTINNLQFMDLHTDPEAANSRLMEEIKNLGAARHKLRDNHEAAFLTVARHAHRLNQVEKRLFSDPLTGLYNRIGLETTLSDWWDHKQHKQRNMIAALYDINGFGAVNHKFGLAAGDRILRHVARFLQTSVGKDDLLGRCAGQQFLAVLLDVNSGVALKNIDLWRQSMEKFVFLRENEPIRVTFSGAVAAVDPSQAYHEVLQRLEIILQEAKQAGPGRVFFHNGTNAAPLETHDLRLEDTHIVI
jgi:diguanylate cyclase (GGDEF)-like protein